MGWILYSDTEVIRKTETDEFSASVVATDLGCYYIADTFPDYTKDDLEVVNGVIQLKSEEVRQAEFAAQSNEYYVSTLRGERNELLKQSDWTQFNDSPLDNTKKQQWATYRQALRDLPATTEDPSSPTWPTKPE